MLREEDQHPWHFNSFLFIFGCIAQEVTPQCPTPKSCYLRLAIAHRPQTNFCETVLRKAPSQKKKEKKVDCNRKRNGGKMRSWCKPKKTIRKQDRFWCQTRFWIAYMTNFLMAMATTKIFKSYQSKTYHWFHNIWSIWFVEGVYLSIKFINLSPNRV